MLFPIDLFADVICPWCFIGTRRLQQALSSLDESVRPLIRHRPFFLIPSTPADGIEVMAMLRERYGAFDPERFFAPAEAAARESGIPLVLARQPRIYSTVAAHTLLRLADRRGIGSSMADALYSAHFLEAQNIARPEVLVPIAAAHGVPEEEAIRVLSDDVERARTRGEAEEGVSLGIRGVPYFVFGGRFALSGAQPLDVFREALAEAIADSRSATV